MGCLMVHSYTSQKIQTHINPACSLTLDRAASFLRDSSFSDAFEPIRVRASLLEAVRGTY